MREQVLDDVRVVDQVVL